jgi:hypothetical protein
MRRASCAAGLLALGLLAKDPTEWKQGKLLNIDVGSQLRVVGYNGMIGTNVRRVFTYSIDGGDRIYDGQEVTGRHGKPVHVEVNGPVEYAVDKNHVYLRDSDGKSHKLDLVRTTRKE